MLAVGSWILADGSIGLQPVHAELVGYWNFHGNVDDLSDHENHDELVGATYSDNISAAIGAGQSISFEENTSHGFIDESDSLNSPQFTLSMFVLDRDQSGAYERHQVEFRRQWRH